jgi:tetratricopeptide (TPR) repeat protein
VETLQVALRSTLGVLLAVAVAFAILAEVGDRRLLADAIMGSAEVLRLGGQHREAEEKYAAALAILLEIGSGKWVLPRMNLGLSLSERGAHREAEAHLRAVLHAMRDAGRTTYDFVLRVMLLPCTAARRDWETWEQDYHAAAELLHGNALSDPDVARAAGRAAAGCRTAGHFDRAARCWEIALAQWQALARPVEVARAAGARTVVTENRRHFTSLLRHGITVLTAEEFAAEQRLDRRKP